MATPLPLSSPTLTKAARVTSAPPAHATDPAEPKPGRRLGVLWVLMLTSLVLILGLQVWHGRSTMDDITVWGTQLLLLASGLACGVAMRSHFGRQLANAATRERHLRGLLTLSADAYWEVDAQWRLSAFRPSDRHDPAHAQNIAGLMGQVVWDLPQFRCQPEVLDRLQADMEAHAAFRNVHLGWLARNGGLHHFSIGGEPRFDTSGRFSGFVGVVRDNTQPVLTSAALHASENRYQELFSRIPSGLILHRNSLVLEANPAALQLFGYLDGPPLVGHNLLALFDGADSVERARRRVEEIERMPLGEALPVADYRMRSRLGVPIAARATAVRVDAGGSPATLSIFVDDTERRRAEVAVRRSEAMLSHLVATSPDVITLTDLSSGRYAMVNHTFERFTGYRAIDVVGKTSIELGIWHDTKQRDRFVATVQEQGVARDMACDFRNNDGSVLPLLVSGAVFAMDGRNYLVINGRDVSQQERERLERAAIFENASIGIAVTRDQHFVHCNPRFAQMFGWDAKMLAGRHASTVWRKSGNYEEETLTLRQRVQSGELVEFERPALRLDGSSFVARVIAKAIDPQRPVTSGALWIVEDVTEQRQAATALARARDQAEAANRAKSAFLANTSHELRTPLNGMLGLAQLASNPTLGPEKRQQYLDQIADNAHALAAIVSDVLDLSKIEAGKLELEVVGFDLPALLGHLRQAYGALCIGRSLSLRFEIDASAQSWVVGDALRVRQVLSNFLSNALKFTEQGEVCLHAYRLPGHPDTGLLRFDITDSGPGLSEATQARLFRPFTQGDESITRRYGGTGLGLSICSELAQLMGGQVGVQSQPGQGACFWAELHLPATSAPSGVAAIDQRALQANEQVLRGASVLMVEDNPVNMLIGAAILERWGIEVEQATDGAQAVTAVLRGQAQGRLFDAVLMDVQMPVLSGHEATRALRGHAGLKHLPIIALTAAALVSERDEALAAGMDDFLTKPIDADKLKATLVRWISARQMH